MGVIISRMLWFFVVASVISYATYLMAGSIVNARASQKNQPVIIRDELRPGEHHLSGMIMVPTPCDELSVRTEAVSSSTFTLVFRTWHEPSVTCSSDEVPRYFRTFLFAPATGVRFTATLDGAGFPIFVMPALPGRAATELSEL